MRPERWLTHDGAQPGIHKTLRRGSWPALAASARGIVASNASHARRHCDEHFQAAMAPEDVATALCHASFSDVQRQATAPEQNFPASWSARSRC